MPQPKKRHSKSRQWKRRANWKLTAPTLVSARNVQQKSSPIMPARLAAAIKAGK